ncbi:hypothetical protein PHLCEN_2v6582 [Hermanssonia centrifuga]|uniref:Uncharacterized protein n=1 Tax=Hermanssonia centrifuga TaxID=98765 RepID=A0A2R6NYZ9_9APHY|nr:hypothetical protein PHLCEN_2v6582 [Hermanssonia centrifuga]
MSTGHLDIRILILILLVYPAILISESRMTEDGEAVTVTSETLQLLQNRVKELEEKLIELADGMFEWKRRYKEVRYREIHRKNGWMMGGQITGYEATPPHTSPATMVLTWRLKLLRQRNHAPPVKPKKVPEVYGESYKRRRKVSIPDDCSSP